MAEQSEWKQFTLGQNPTLAKIAEQAKTASALMNTNIGIAKTTIELAKVFLLMTINPALALLNAVANEIDNLVSDFRQQGIFSLVVLPVGGDLAQAKTTQTIKITQESLQQRYTAAKNNDKLHEFSIWLGRAFPDQVPSGSNTFVKEGIFPESNGEIWPKRPVISEIPRMLTTLGHPTIKIGAAFKFATYDENVGMWRMTPTQVIATMKASLVDELDENRPQFTSSARVGAWVAIMGVPSFDKLKDLSDILKTVKKFFGVSHTAEEIQANFDNKTDKKLRASQRWSQVERNLNIRDIKLDPEDDTGKTIRPEFYIKDDPAAGESPLVYYPGPAWIEIGGPLDGLERIGNLMVAGLGLNQLDGSVKGSEVTLNVRKIRGVRNNLNFSDSSGGGPAGKDLIAEGVTKNFPSEFKKGDFVRLQRGFSHSHAVVNTVVSTTETTSGMAINSLGQSAKVQQLVVNPVGTQDLVQFSNGAEGYWITRIFEKERFPTFTDDTGQTHTSKIPVWEHYNLRDIYDRTRKTKKMKWSDTVVPGPHTTTAYGAGGMVQVDVPPVFPESSRSDVSAWKRGDNEPAEPPFDSNYNVWQTTTGECYDATEKAAAPPPNWNRSTPIEKLIPPFGTFLNMLSGFAETLRGIAKDTSKGLTELIDFMDIQIENLDELNSQIQYVLSFFTIGLPAAGIYWLFLPQEEGGTDGMISRLESAEGRPPDDLEFSAGLFFLGGGPSMKVMDSLLASAS